jgi:hypothetical protein
MVAFVKSHLAHAVYNMTVNILDLIERILIKYFKDKSKFITFKIVFFSQICLLPISMCCVARNIFLKRHAKSGTLNYFFF